MTSNVGDAWLKKGDHKSVVAMVPANMTLADQSWVANLSDKRSASMARRPWQYDNVQRQTGRRESRWNTIQIETFGATSANF